MENALQARKQAAHPGLMMVSMLLGAFVGMFSETSLNISLPKLMIAFQVSTSTIQWLVTGYMLIIGIILPLSSIITKWFTTRQVIIFALIDFMVGACISALAHRNRFNSSINVCSGNANLPTETNWSGSRNVCPRNYVCTCNRSYLNRANSC